jgi:isopentenyl diphosphate isomerase/L-lactate dehydrogenase-like FMN-dependent dehydrogenase
VRDKLTWDYVKRVRDFTKMDVFVKGIMDVEDALMCVKVGCGVYVSNHGGRNEDTGKSSIAAFSEIAPIIKNKAPMFVDGGFRRGMDIVKALSMGATMVGFGRPYLWGLGAFGEAGVDKVIQIMKAEVTAAMQQVGVTSVKELEPRLVQRAI